MPEAALRFTYLLLKPLLSRLFNPTLCRQKEFVYSLKIVIMTLSCWSFFSQSRLDFFLKIAAPFPALSILTILIDYCHTKSCFEAMNILIKPFSSSVLGWSEKNFFWKFKKVYFGNPGKWSKNRKKNRLEPVAIYHGLATPPKNWSQGGKMAIKSCYLITASRRDLIYSSKVAESSYFYEC